MALTVLVPGAEGLRALDGVPGLRAVAYDPQDPLGGGSPGAELAAAMPVAQALVTGNGPQYPVEPVLEFLPRLPALRLVQTLSAGTDAWLGRLPPGVGLSSAAGAHGATTAEWALAALLAVYRQLPAFGAAQDQRRWAPRLGDTLVGCRVLVIGAGDLGTNLRTRLEPFEASVTLVASRARDGVRGPREVPDLLPHHDVVVLMLPLNDRTRGMVDAGFLARMPDGAVLVNAARGAIVDTEALLAELTAGRLRAALDVTDPEPLPPEHPLWRAPGVLITPHVGSMVRGWQERAWDVAARQLGQLAAGRRPENQVG